ncbi:hypothetical protein SASPL_130791 [Salvia splendens]|uniref:Uncharacterized protein n=1 Tax=Salvia splendens TaxID=180675 RepID=A0A8X8X8V5_SALSN|nr:hypothetical protein SASPL_130791 [Salvia splendens]
MVPAMVACVETMLEKWRSYHGKEIEVCSEFRLLSSEVISRTAFGSSYLEGRKIFDMLSKLGVLISKNVFKIRLFGFGRFIRTRDDIEADKTEQLLHDSIMEIVKKRQSEVQSGKADSFGSDLLGSLLKGHHDTDPKSQISAAEIIDELIIGKKGSSDDKAKAQGVLYSIESFDFIFMAQLMTTIFGYTNDLCLALQRRDQYIINTMRLVTLTKDQLQKMRDVGWEIQLNKVISICNNLGIVVPDMEAQYIPQGRSKRFVHDVSYLHHFWVDVFMKVIDLLLQELDNRFDEVNMELIRCMACFYPKDNFSSFDKEKVNMILYETLGLYTPATNILRRIGSRVKLGKFSEGMAKATNGNPTAFLGFGYGPRTFGGLNLATSEAKIALSMILQRYKFTLSPEYVHSPLIVLTAHPQLGVGILLQPL